MHWLASNYQWLVAVVVMPIILLLLKQWADSRKKETGPVPAPQATLNAQDSHVSNSPVAGGSAPGTRRKLFQLGYLYGQYGVTDYPGRAGILKQIEQYWGAISDRPPSEAVPENLRSMPFSHIVGELASFLRTSLGDRFPAQTDGDLCLLGFMLFCQPFARDSTTAELVIKYSAAARLSDEERKELRKDCLAPDLGTRDGGMSFFNKWTGFIEKRLSGC